MLPLGNNLSLCVFNELIYTVVLKDSSLNQEGNMT